MMVNQRRSNRRKYDRASTTDDDPGGNDADRSPPLTSTLQNADKDSITIQILDSAQNRFNVPSIEPTTCTVQQLKDIGCAIHGVSPPQQRLIYMGKPLNEDASCLSHYGIEKELSIIHLFPKPTVVIERNAGDDGEDTSLCSPTSNDNDANDTETAHIPQIILDASEAERHSSVIILSSHEAFEVLHRVRLCAFCLLVYSSMELLQDLTLWMGKSLSDSNEYCDDDDHNGCPEYRPDEPTDTTAPSPYGDTNPQWESWTYFDVLLSLFAFYVSMLGIKVTTEHERKTARLFWNLLVLLAVLWNGFYYWRAVEDILDKRLKAKGSKESGGDNYSNDSSNSDEDEQSSKEMSPYVLALWYMSFLFLIWFVFLYWARQFKNLMEEAGAEAEERTRSLSNGNALGASGYGGAGSIGVDSNATQTGQGAITNGSVADSTSGTTSEEVYDLELQREGRSIT